MATSAENVAAPSQPAQPLPAAASVEVELRAIISELRAALDDLRAENARLREPFRPGSANGFHAAVAKQEPSTSQRTTAKVVEIDARRRKR